MQCTWHTHAHDRTGPLVQLGHNSLWLGRSYRPDTIGGMHASGHAESVHMVMRSLVVRWPREQVVVVWVFFLFELGLGTIMLSLNRLQNKQKKKIWGPCLHGGGT